MPSTQVPLTHGFGSQLDGIGGAPPCSPAPASSAEPAWPEPPSPEPAVPEPPAPAFPELPACDCAPACAPFPAEPAGLVPSSSSPQAMATNPISPNVTHEISLMTWSSFSVRSGVARIFCADSPAITATRTERHRPACGVLDTTLNLTTLIGSRVGCTVGEESQSSNRSKSKNKNAALRARVRCKLVSSRRRDASLLVEQDRLPFFFTARCAHRDSARATGACAVNWHLF